MWAEAAALELATLWLAETDQNDVCTIIHSDNMGVIDTFKFSTRGDCETCIVMIVSSESL